VHDIDEIRIYSAFGKLQQMKPNFGEIMLKALFDHDHHAATLGEQPVPWRVVHRHYATSPHFPQVFDPHVQAEDVMWRHAGQVLANYVPDMLFWHDTDHVGYLHEGKPVSYNLMDVAVNYCNRLHFNDRVTHNLQAALWNELLRRYVSQEAIEQAVLAQLDHSLPEGMPQDELVGIF
jgi:hypothetical protein